MFGSLKDPDPLGFCVCSLGSGVGTLGRCRPGVLAELLTASRGSPGSAGTNTLATGMLEVCERNCRSLCSSVTAHFGGLAPRSQWALLGIMETLEVPLPAFGLALMGSASHSWESLLLLPPWPGSPQL